ncbi:ATP-binding protein [Natronococcus sp. A-GB7]|uniref:ATP-binding protein n=1 Tax=Natronococcus sp. A-GB7 TaxID=3037649 RepID=UPI00241E4B11|nr:ATP-binding protein [Natronococcus sp. A-GB7]MDG5821521.1 ATP-binding protein [Natronococcus sp. A-GB7]
MDYSSRFSSSLDGRRLVLILGSLYILIAIGRAAVHAMSGTPLIPIFVITIFIGGSGLVLLVGGYRLPVTEVHPRFYSTIAKWCFVGIGTMFVFLTLYHVQPDTSIVEPNRLVPILTGFSAVAGFGIGTNAAKAKTNAFELERQNRKLKQIQDQLEESNKRLEKSNKRLEQFAYAASHDLQEPLRMVSSYLQLIERRYSDEFDEDGREFLEYAISGSERMSSMIEGLLKYSRVDTRGKPLEPVDLDTVLSESLQDLELQIEESNATIEAVALPRVKGDANQLHQLFQNLISNGIEYSGNEPPQIDISAERNGEEWIISVHDRGIGIDSDAQDQIFEVFQRLHSHEEHVGSGIGLALCRRIVERHGGKIWVESEPGEGSTFVFTLPAVTNRKATRNSPPSA